MTEQYVIERLADKSAFVFFEKHTYKTYILQHAFMLDFFTQKNLIRDESEFEQHSFENQVELILSSGITDKLQ